jgi:Sulfotransferase family
MSGECLRVLYVLGIYHSGTTLLSNLLGQLEGFFCVGELRSVWRKSMVPNARCGCGERMAECQIWSQILHAVLGEQHDREALARKIWQWQREAVHEVHTWRYVPGLLRQRSRGLPEGTPLASYAKELASMYRAIAAETGAAVIVDSSKEPTDAALLLMMPEVDVTFVQIVRDPRGTANSILRFRDGGQPATQRRLRQSAYAALSWSAGNMAGAAVRRAVAPSRSMLVRYEDFVSQPADTVHAIAELAGKPAWLAAHPEPGKVYLDTVHTVGGNNNRFRTGEIQLSEETTWRSQLHPLNRAAVTIMCAPLMARYGYQLAS